MDFILGGYFIVIPAKRSEYMNSELLPDEIISVSNCICDIVPSYWALDWVTNRENDIKRAKDRLKLNDKEFLELEKWTTYKFNLNSFGWQHGFIDLETAKEFKRLFLNKVEKVYIVSIGLIDEEADKAAWYAGDDILRIIVK